MLKTRKVISFVGQCLGCLVFPTILGTPFVAAIYSSSQETERRQEEISQLRANFSLRIERVSKTKPDFIEGRVINIERIGFDNLETQHQHDHFLFGSSSSSSANIATDYLSFIMLSDKRKFVYAGQFFVNEGEEVRLEAYSPRDLLVNKNLLTELSRIDARYTSRYDAEDYNYYNDERREVTRDMINRISLDREVNLACNLIPRDELLKLDGIVADYEVIENKKNN